MSGGDDPLLRDDATATKVLCIEDRLDRTLPRPTVRRCFCSSEYLDGRFCRLNTTPRVNCNQNYFTIQQALITNLLAHVFHGYYYALYAYNYRAVGIR